MQAADSTAAVQLLSGIVTQLGKDDALSDSVYRHACAALLTVQAVRSSSPQQQSKLHETFQKLLEAVMKRISKAQAQEQSLALQLLAACIRVCDAVTLLQKAVDWGTQLSEALRKAAAAAAQQAAATEASSAQQPAAPASASAVILAGCAAATELCRRLQQYVELPAVRREVSGVAPKLLQPLLSVLDNSSLPDATQAAALQLVAALVRCVPSSLRPAASSLTRLLQQLVTRTAASTAGSSVSTAGGPVKQQLLAQAAVCAALLPAVAGDAAAWSDAARGLMASCHDVLDQLLMGLEGRPVDAQYRSHLGAAPGQQQGQQATAAAGEAGGWLGSLPWQQQEQQQQQGAVARRQTVPAMLLASFCVTALQHLLQQPFAVPVPVPGYSLALLAARLHRFDAAAAVAAGAVPGSSTMYQDLLVLQPELQLAGWQLLHEVIRSCGQQLQLQGVLLRLVRQGLHAVQLSGPAALLQQPAEVRHCLYNTAALLLQATGLAGARGLAAEAMGCAVLELYGHTATAAGGAASGTGQQQRPAKRARKSGGATGTELGQFDPAAAVAAAAGTEEGRLAAASGAELQAQAAVLGVLRGLLAAGGQVLPAEVRAHADAVAYHISATSAQLAVQLGQQPALSAAAAAATAGSAGLTALQVAAYEALLASVLVPCSHRPPFLSQAVVLFRQDRSSSNAAVAALCQSAAMQVEVLLHPRATAMGVVRQYAGLEAVPALAKPRLWDAFAPQQPQAQQQQPGSMPAAGAAAANGGAGLHPAAAANGGSGVVFGGSRTQQQPAGAQNGPVPLPLAAGAEVVMGYPVHSQAAAPQQQQQQHPPGAQGQAMPASAQPAAAAPAIQEPQGAAAMVADGAGQPELPIAAFGPEQGGQLAGVYQQPQSGAVTILAAPVDDARPVHHQAPPAVAAAKAAAVPVFEDESSDSEGPLPDIDSGAASSSSEEDEG